MTMHYNEPFSEKPIIKVVGVGGGGGNAINRMIENEVKGVDFIAINTDAQVLRLAKADTRLQIGKRLTKGMGAGADPDVGRQAAEESEAEIRTVLEGSDMVFITAGMGGGTGTGASPVVARIAREMGCLTVGIVTKPFTFEGRKRMNEAEKGIHELKQYVDTLVIVPNDKLSKMSDGNNMSMLEAFREVDNVLRRGVQGIAEIITIPGLINVDFADVRNVMANKGTALMGIGIAKGPNRAVEATRKAIRSPLLEIDINGATDAIVFITSDIDIAMNEVYDVTNEIRNASSPDIEIIIGTGFNVDLDGELIVTVIATGFDRHQHDGTADRPFESADEIAEADPKDRYDFIRSSEPEAEEKAPEVKVGRKQRDSNDPLPDWLRGR